MLVFSKNTGLEKNTQKALFLVIKRMQDKIIILKIANKSLKNVTNPNCIHEETESGSESGICCYHLVLCSPFRRDNSYV